MSIIAVDQQSLVELSSLLAKLKAAEQSLSTCPDAIATQSESEADTVGKGSTPRPPQVATEVADKNWEAVFGQVRKHVCRKFVNLPDHKGRVCYFCGEPDHDELNPPPSELTW